MTEMMRRLFRLARLMSKAHQQMEFNLMPRATPVKQDFSGFLGFGCSLTPGP